MGEPLRLRTPRRLLPAESLVVRRLLDFSVTSLRSVLQTSFEQLIVIDSCDCGCDSLYFFHPRCIGEPVAHALGRTADGLGVEVLLWARGTLLTFLEIEPQPRCAVPARLPRPDSLIPHLLHDLPGAQFATGLQSPRCQ